MLPVSPCRSAFLADRAFPSGVFGPPPCFFVSSVLMLFISFEFWSVVLLAAFTLKYGLEIAGSAKFEVVENRGDKVVLLKNGGS